MDVQWTYIRWHAFDVSHGVSVVTVSDRYWPMLAI